MSSGIKKGSVTELSFGDGARDWTDNRLLTWKAPEWFLMMWAELQGRGNVEPDKTCISLWAGSSSQVLASSQKIIHFLTWEGSDFLFKGSCKAPQVKPGKETEHVTISKVLPQQLPGRILKATPWEQAGLHLWLSFYRWWNWGLEKTRTRGQRSSGKGRSRSWFPHNCPVIFTPQHIISGQIDFSQNRVDSIPVCIYTYLSI